jgi:hypothetical protein
MSANEYRSRFGLPWTRGLTWAASRATSGWSEQRKAKAKELAQRSGFFKLAHLTARRTLALYLKIEAIQNLGIELWTQSEAFDRRGPQSV